MIKPTASKRLFGFPLRVWKRWSIVAGIAVVLFLFFFGRDGVWHTMLRKRYVDSIEARVDTLASLNKEMRVRMEAHKSKNTSALEEEARGRNMIKKGEKVYVVQEKPESK